MATKSGVAYRAADTNVPIDLLHAVQDLLLIHWPGAAHHALSSPAHARLRLESWRTLEEFYESGK